MDMKDKAHRSAAGPKARGTRIHASVVAAGAAVAIVASTAVPAIAEEPDVAPPAPEPQSSVATST